MRLFIGIEFQQDILERLYFLQNELRNHMRSGRFPDKDNLHLTLQFFGDTPANRVKDIIQVLAGVARNNRAFMLSFGQLGYFGQGNPIRVVWLGLNGDLKALRRLQAGIVLSMQELGFKDERRAYSPHITLAREADFAGNEGMLDRGQIQLDIGQLPAFYVSKFSLISSSVEQGKRIYRALATFTLNEAKQG